MVKQDFVSVTGMPTINSLNVHHNLTCLLSCGQRVMLYLSYLIWMCFRFV